MLYPVELQVHTLPTASTPRPIVCSVFRFRLRCSFVRRPYVGFVETITVSVSSLLTVEFIKISSVFLGFAALTVLSVLFLVVSLFDFHATNLINCCGGGT